VFSSGPITRHVGSPSTLSLLHNMLARNKSPLVYQPASSAQHPRISVIALQPFLIIVALGVLQVTVVYLVVPVSLRNNGWLDSRCDDIEVGYAIHRRRWRIIWSSMILTLAELLGFPLGLCNGFVRSCLDALDHALDHLGDFFDGFGGGFSSICALAERRVQSLQGWSDVLGLWRSRLDMLDPCFDDGKALQLTSFFTSSMFGVSLPSMSPWSDVAASSAPGRMLCVKCFRFHCSTAVF
jgi:hypothetical protein